MLSFQYFQNKFLITSMLKNMKLKSNGFETVQSFIIFYKQNHLRNATKFLFNLLFFDDQFFRNKLNSINKLNELNKIKLKQTIEEILDYPRSFIFHNNLDSNLNKIKLITDKIASAVIFLCSTNYL